LPSTLRMLLIPMLNSTSTVSNNPIHTAREIHTNFILQNPDYNLDDESWDKLKGLVAKVNQWVSEGVPIHGIGSQTHLQKGKTYHLSVTEMAAY
jgi:GH35 family endo-1,4-beta-xylanase